MADDGPSSNAALLRFSRAIPYPVFLLVVSGAVLAFIQLGHVAALWTTAYGLVLDAKAVLLLALFGLAALNRFRLTPRLEVDDVRSRRAMCRSIVVETVLVVLIFAVVASWRFTPPPRAQALETAPPVHFHIHGQRAMADVTLSPGRAGAVAISLSVLDGEFGPLPAKEVTVTLSNPAAGLEPIRKQAVQVDGAAWRVDGLTVPVAGRWSAKVDILVSDFDQITLQDAFDMPD
jgi:copper transport protein